MKTLQTKKSTEKTHQMAAANKTAAAKNNSASFEDNRSSSVIQQKNIAAMNTTKPIQQKKNNTGLPDTLKSGMENLSGHSLDDVKVHYNSSKPAQLNAHAYAQGKNIHLASGQEKHLPHEAWHVVQQKQGRVQPTKTVAGANINDNASLEKEADVMGAKALQRKVIAEKKNPNVTAKNNVIDSTVYLTDNRTRNTTQLKSAATNTTIQLVKKVDLTKLTATVGQKYYINASAPEELFSKRGVPPPRPIGFYTRIDASYAKSKYMYGWIPNARFLSNEEKGMTPTYMPGGARSLQYQTPKLGGLLGRNTHTFDVAAEKAALENPQKGSHSDRLPKLGVLGKNDCGIFAESLQHLIAQEEPNRTSKGAVSETLNVNAPINANKLSLGVGDKMIHNFNGTALNSGHHAATVVAKDGSSLVTLEAHVGKSLKKPQFHIRNGVKGFVADNNVGHGWLGQYDRQLGDSVHISRIGSMNKQEVSGSNAVLKNRYTEMSNGQDGLGGDAYYLTTHVGTTKTRER